MFGNDNQPASRKGTPPPRRSGSTPSSSESSSRPGSPASNSGHNSPVPRPATPQYTGPPYRAAPGWGRPVQGPPRPERKQPPQPTSTQIQRAVATGRFPFNLQPPPAPTRHPQRASTYAGASMMGGSPNPMFYQAYAQPLIAQAQREQRARRQSEDMFVQADQRARDKETRERTQVAQKAFNKLYSKTDRDPNFRDKAYRWLEGKDVSSSDDDGKDGNRGRYYGKRGSGKKDGDRSGEYPPRPPPGSGPSGFIY